MRCLSTDSNNRRQQLYTLLVINSLKSTNNFTIHPNINVYQITIHNHDSRATNNFRLPTSNLTKYQKVVYARIKIFKHLPTHIKCVVSEMQVFKKTLKTFLPDKSFYSIDEYINSNK
jgi:hypothetical protein